MTFTETFPLCPNNSPRLFWMPGYITLSRDVYNNYSKTGETSERARHVSNCASRWGISRRCAEAILNDECTYELADNSVIITRPVIEA